MSQHPLHVMFLWHMHQPYYKDLNNQEYLLPWVRLHATKDYLDMPLLASEFPSLRITFNMVPSLLEQIEEYAAGDVRDPYLDLARKPAESLDDNDRLRLLQTFFAAQYERMIKPYPRYLQLYERRGWNEGVESLRRAARTFSTADLRDLQTWFYLTWIDPLLRESDPRLTALMRKGQMFTEEDKRDVLEIGRAFIGQIIPTLKDLWAKGQIEISTTPYFHPILPLLVDTDFARRARPKITLPHRRFQHPEDAREQIEMGLAYCQQLFGRRPGGMWPSEGSVCPELIPMFHEAGVRWVATDEEVLASSLGVEHFIRDREGVVERADLLYRPYIASFGGQEAALFFRDHFLSDLLGFKYAHWRPQDAAADLIRRLEEIQQRLAGSDEPHVVSIILDGENCWEHYERDGIPFLRALYQGLTSHRSLKTVTPSEYLAAFPHQRRLERLHSGSWINRDYSVWIGHPEDNASWDLLTQAREDIGSRLNGSRPAGSVDEAARRQAVKSLMIAEGSDWNWWYGDEHPSDFKGQFDALYRQHLSNAYQAVGLEAPGRLFIPISTHKDTGLQAQPSAFISPRIDGKLTHFFEWSAAGHYDPQRAGDSMHQAEHIIQSLYFGFDRRSFYLRFDLGGAFRASSGSSRTPSGSSRTSSGSAAELILYLFTQHNYKIVCPLGDHGAADARVYREDEEQGWTEAGPPPEWAAGEILEFNLPIDRFQIAPDKTLRVQAAIEVGDHEIERCPSRAPLTTSVPNQHFEEIMWIV